MWNHPEFGSEQTWTSFMVLRSSCKTDLSICVFFFFFVAFSQFFPLCVCLCLPFSAGSVYSSENFSRSKKTGWWLGNPLLRTGLHFLQECFGKHENVSLLSPNSVFIVIRCHPLPLSVCLI